MSKKAAKVINKAKGFFKSNPPIVQDVFKYIVPAGGAYVATRLAGRAARTFVGDRFPKARPFLGPIGSLAAFGAIWYVSHKTEWGKKNHLQLMVGSGIAVVQSLVTTVLPGMAWLFDTSVPAPKLKAPVTDEEDSDMIEVSDQSDTGADENTSSNDDLDGLDDLSSWGTSFN